jgi:hypothetical protein
LTETLRDLEAVHFRHLKIEQDQIRKQSLGLFDGLSTAGSGSDYFNRVLRLEEGTNCSNCCGGVVHDQRPNMYRMTTDRNLPISSVD